MTSIDLPYLRSWIGRSETRADTATVAPISGLAALLDCGTSLQPPQVVPYLGHWLYFLSQTARSLIGDDGHPRTGDFLPPVPLPRRMWAGGEIRFLAPIPVSAPMQRQSVVSGVTHKVGKSGDLIFLTVEHHITVDGVKAIAERQDLVYRGPPGDGTTSPTQPTDQNEASGSRYVTLTPVDLFRFSALTFNAHRIHYDRDYARNTEGHADLVVHAPYTAILLINHLMQEMPNVRIQSFSFQAKNPLFVNREVALTAVPQEDGIRLIATDGNGVIVMTAYASTVPRQHQWQKFEVEI